MARSLYLAVIMRERGISQGEVVRRTKLSKPTVMDAFHGREVHPWTLAVIAKHIKVPLHEIDPGAADDIDGLVVR